jgi:transposase-like protein
MTKEFLEGCLAEGMSLAAIGALVGRDPSTVSYHLRKHGLVPVGHEKHSPNGRVDPEILREVIEAGATVREAAEKLGVGYTTIRHWLKRLGLQTPRMARLQESQAAIEQGLTRTQLDCPRHGRVPFFRRPDGNYRCSKCRTEAVVEWRRRAKLRLVERAGGCCVLCGYAGHPSALQFHHLEPSEKRFSLSREGTTRSFAEAAEEADKCVLLCANCHAEVEAGAKELPAATSSIGKVDEVQPPQPPG